MKLFSYLAAASVNAIENYISDSFYDFYVDTIYPDVLRRDAKGQEYFILPTQDQLTRFSWGLS